jgi:hypothetical protein
VSAPAGSDAKQPRFTIDVLRADDTDAIAQAAALLVEAFPHWLPTLELARDEEPVSNPSGCVQQ